MSRSLLCQSCRLARRSPANLHASAPLRCYAASRGSGSDDEDKSWGDIARDAAKLARWELAALLT